MRMMMIGGGSDRRPTPTMAPYASDHAPLSPCEAVDRLMPAVSAR
jgi:hypothetical protein